MNYLQKEKPFSSHFSGVLSHVFSQATANNAPAEFSACAMTRSGGVRKVHDCSGLEGKCAGQGIRKAVALTVVVGLFGALPVEAESQHVSIGLAVALPAAGISVRMPIGERFDAGLIIGAGVQAQVNYDGKTPGGNYSFFGAGKDGLVGLIRGGYGYEWRLKSFSVHAEVGLNLPIWVNDDAGLAVVGYLVPFGFGAHYYF